MVISMRHTLCCKNIRNDIQGQTSGPPSPAVIFNNVRKRCCLEGTGRRTSCGPFPSYTVVGLENQRLLSHYLELLPWIPYTGISNLAQRRAAASRKVQTSDFLLLAVEVAFWFDSVYCKSLWKRKS